MVRRIAVTGVASGIGAELAALLTAQGDHVVGFDRVETDQNVAEFVPLDLSDPASIAKAAAAVTGRLDGLCNNAGLPPRDGLEALILQVNFIGTRHFTDLMVDKLTPGASLVNMASRAGAQWRQNLEQVLRLGALSGQGEVAGFVEAEGLNATRSYNLSKEAVIAWSTAATEAMIARDIRINTISPGAVATGILEDFARVFGEVMARNVARAGRAGHPKEVAQLAAFLLSDASAWIKGIDIPIDGGMGGFNMADQLGLGPMNRGRR